MHRYSPLQEAKGFLVQNDCVLCNGTGYITDNGKKKKKETSIRRKLKNRRVELVYNGSLVGLKFKRLAIVDGKKRILRQDLVISQGAALAVFELLSVLFCGKCPDLKSLSPHGIALLMQMLDVGMSEKHWAIEDLLKMLNANIENAQDQEILKEIDATLRLHS